MQTLIYGRNKNTIGIYENKDIWEKGGKNVTG